MIREYLAKRKTRRVLGKYVTPDALEAILQGNETNRQVFTAARIEYVLAFVRGDAPKDISQRVGKVAEIAMSHDGIVYDLVCELVVVAFGAHPVSSPTAGK
jgi:hypothetical protein